MAALPQHIAPALFFAAHAVIFVIFFAQPSLYNFAVAGALSTALILIHNRYGYGLLQYNGPILASLTTFWRVRDSYINGNKRPTIVQLHQRYGDVIRLGPNFLFFASPSAVADIYQAGNNMRKVCLL